MSKSKKHKKPNIPVSALARPRLDAILSETGHEPEATVALITMLVRELGTAPVLDSFVKRVQSASPAEQARLCELAKHLRTDENKTHLWNLVKRPGGMSDDAKRAALSVLQAMGEEIALDDTTRYLPSPRPKSPSKPNQAPLRIKDTLSLIQTLEEIDPNAELSEQDQARISEIIAQSAFSPPVEQFLHLDRPAEIDSRNYIELGITATDVPELIRMAISRELNRAPFPSSLVWAPIHAWRALGQLRATEAVEPVLSLLQYIDKDQDDWIGEDMPLVFGQIGPAALAPLGEYLADSLNPLWARVAAPESIHDIGKNFPEAREPAIAMLTDTLERYAENDPILNADIIYALTRLHATATLPLIEKAFAENRVDESLNGDWEDLQIELGLKTARANPRRKTFLDNIRLP